MQIYTEKGAKNKFSPQFLANLSYQAYLRKASILVWETGSPVISSKRAINICMCLVGIFFPARWLRREWISCVDIVCCAILVYDFQIEFFNLLSKMDRRWTGDGPVLAGRICREDFTWFESTKDDITEPASKCCDGPIFRLDLHCLLLSWIPPSPPPR